MRRAALLLVMLANAGASLAEVRPTPDQVVMLHLERGGKHIRHEIPFHFPRTRSFRFCIPKSERFIRYVEVLREGSPAVVLRIPRGAPCLTRTLEAGDYRLVVEHDGSEVPAGGKRAFVHVPRLKQGTLTAAAPSGFDATCGSDNWYPNLYTFTAPDGSYVNGGGAVHTGTTPDDLVAPGGWSICPDGLGTYTVTHLDTSSSYFTTAAPPATDRRILDSTSGTPARFKVVDLGDSQFTLSASFDGALYPVVVGPDGVLSWADSGNPTVFTIAIVTQKGLADYPPLQVGEVGFYVQSCNYDAWPRYVVRRDVPSLAPFNAFFTGPLDNSFASLQTGPQTATRIYADANYAGATQTAGAPVSCLSGALAGSVSSIEVLPDRELIIATDTCKSCDLSGVNLSGLDLSGGQFQGSTFTGADLTGTNFQSASLDGASFAGATTVLTNTSFLGAIVRCTSFAANNLSSATFQIPNVFKPILTTDFSCWLDLAGATLNLDSFSLDDWRYMDLSGASITGGLSGVTLSPTSEGKPRDFSGGIFDHMELQGTKLDGANFGCATSGTGGPVCTRLTGTNLIGASLKKATFTSAVLQGAKLGYANLDAANLCGARLNESAAGQSASLVGAFLHAVNLAQADLTGADLTNASFYSGFSSGSGPSSCQPSPICNPTPTCASAVKATLNNAIFSGAYLSGVDFTDATPQGVDFSNAYLPGANFTNANLSRDERTLKRTNFTGATLQGATLPQTTDYATFLSGYVNLASSGTLLVKIPDENLKFTGFKPATNRTPGCVQYTYSHPTAVTGSTGTTNTCPNGDFGPCSNAQWTAPQVPAPALPSNCTSSTYDYNWLSPPQ